ncbi:hypothetical protein ILYODFUR_026679, partial [Ilyodon furcidens]
MNEPFPYVCAPFVLRHVMMHIEGLAQVHLCNRSGLFYSRGGLHALFETSEFLCFRQKAHRSPPLSGRQGKWDGGKRDEFILNQDWNDPKSQLQQCCLTLRTEGKEPDIPLYKTLQTVGPSHARTYTVAVYFKGERIGCGKGPSIQQAEMGAAMDALEK